MKYDHILIRYGELALKGKNRVAFEKQLLANIRQVLKPIPGLKVKRTFGRIVVELYEVEPTPVMKLLKNIFGIHSFSLAIRVDNELAEMQKAALKAVEDSEGTVRTFKIITRRAYKPFPIDSQTLNHKIGGFVLANTNDITVDVHQPDATIRVEVRETATYITTDAFKGAGGLPAGTSGKMLLMLSGGIDSPVAGYLAMKRGADLEAIHFHSPPYTSERAKEKVIDLVRKLNEFGGQIKLHIVPFTNIQTHIRDEAPSNFQMTIMRRMMMRISAKLAEDRGLLGIATGDSLGQVASQTLHSIHTINEVTNYPVIRPLITMDKLEVIDLAKKIGTYETSILPYEDCCTIFLPSDSKTKPSRKHANKFEQYIEVDHYLNEAIAGIETLDLTNMTEVEKSIEDLF
ncbi:tRNA uracil 4-sulfurtransferase ThiI [Alkalicoccobacillus murimartini]|uniref:Probable tRNA sulfurtransferase n=1 Tax=Alkalicoccobacillus murimartini TaxID=171685 RepID=A0ABT9YJU2_9BACI|nr:tRNA uracil 4-sulfurtransferase ThiI [Alkalicoccobacillus murimartini]MDQ0208128.1 thiamine biosynthesis protein ThiI [Alkalicoccobacillus murimartini]